MSRWLKFFLALLLGLVAGLIYGWVISPVEYINTTPEMLSLDHRTDMVLMIAELYPYPMDLNTAGQTLEQYFIQSPVVTAEEALAYAQASGYSQPDITLIQNLVIAFQAAQPGASP